MHGTNLGDGLAYAFIVGCIFALFALAAYIADRRAATLAEREYRQARQVLRQAAHDYARYGQARQLRMRLAVAYSTVLAARHEWLTARGAL